jgi:hypothetical protein
VEPAARLDAARGTERTYFIMGGRRKEEEGLLEG